MDYTATAVGLLRSGKLEELKQYCEEILQEHNTEIELWKLYGIALAELGNPTIARYAFNAALQLDPKDQMVLCNLITSYFDEGDKDRALNLINTHISKFEERVCMPLYQNVCEALDVGLIEISELSEEVVVRINEFAQSEE